MAKPPPPAAIPETIEKQGTGTGDDLEARVIVYNCSCHTYQQVITLFCEAIPGMNPHKAFELAWQIDPRAVLQSIRGTGRPQKVLPSISSEAGCW